MHIGPAAGISLKLVQGLFPQLVQNVASYKDRIGAAQLQKRVPLCQLVKTEPIQ